MDAGSLTIALTEPKLAPFVTGSEEGLDADVAREIARRLDIDQLSFTKSELINRPSVAFDVWLGWWNQPDLEGDLDLGEPYFDIAVALLAREGTPLAEADEASDLAGYRIGLGEGLVVLGNAGDALEYVVETTLEPYDVEYVTYGGAKSATAALAEDDAIDGVLAYVYEGVPLAEEFSNIRVVGQFTTPMHYIPVFMEGSGLRGCVNEALAEMKADGTLVAIQEKWLPGSTSLPTLG